MGLITKTVKIKWSVKTKKYYEELGYVYTKIGKEFEVKIGDLQKGSNVKVCCICDNCGCNLMPTFYDYNKTVKQDGKTYCNNCAKILYSTDNMVKTKLKNSKSLYDWCIENNRQDVLDRWDYKLNNCSPKDVGYSTNKKMWFKCLKNPKHKSELKNINHFTSGYEGSMDCKQCNSIAQYILDNFPNKKLEEVWDFEKNGDLDLWSISRGSKIKIWIICQEKDYHESYETMPNQLSRGDRCPFCSGKKIHSLDSLGRYVIDNYGEEFLWKIWCEKNDISPFELSIYSGKKVWWNCTDNKHESFKRSCDNSVRYEFRCPDCVKERKESFIEESTRVYLQELNYKVKTEYSCSFIPKNPKTKQPLPFDNEIVLSNGEHLIIEVHGGQHYKSDYFMTRKKITKEEAENELHYQQVKDRYKRIKCIQAGYYYLEIPYTAFDKKETYKTLIDNKIKEILEK